MYRDEIFLKLNKHTGVVHFAQKRKKNIQFWKKSEIFGKIKKNSEKFRKFWKNSENFGKIQKNSEKFR